MSLFSDMESWYGIVRSYDDPELKDPTRKDDGTYSQFSVVMVMNYLIFGKDYPYHIAQYFQNLLNSNIRNHNRSSVLRYPNRLAVLLNKMSKDELIIMSEEKDKKRTKKKYKINPKIIQSIFRNKNYYKRDGSILGISLEKIEKALAVLEKLNEKNELRDRLFARNVPTPTFPEKVDLSIFLVSFLSFTSGYWSLDENPDIMGLSEVTNHVLIYLCELRRLSMRFYNYSEFETNILKFLKCQQLKSL
jgi:hypothetical protein